MRQIGQVFEVMRRVFVAFSAVGMMIDTGTSRRAIFLEIIFELAIKFCSITVGFRSICQASPVARSRSLV